jgi:hypothetical protein
MCAGALVRAQESVGHVFQFVNNVLSSATAAWHAERNFTPQICSGVAPAFAGDFMARYLAHAELQALVTAPLTTDSHL